VEEEEEEGELAERGANSALRGLQTREVNIIVLYTIACLELTASFVSAASLVGVCYRSSLAAYSA